MGGLPVGPEWTDLAIFKLFSDTKSELKGVRFMKKNANSCILGPILWAVVDILGGLPIGPQLSNFKIFELFSTQNPNSKGSVLLKKLPTHVLEAPFCGPFSKMGGSADRPRMDRFENFSTIYHTKSELKGGPFYEKIC